jgi:cell wall-associated NlpC family hydrolase
VSRSILTGIFVLALSASCFTLAAADESTVAVPQVPVTGSVVASAGTANAAPANAAPTVAGTSPDPSMTSSASESDSDDAAPPTAGADLVMWNAAPVRAEAVLTPDSGPHANRLRRFASGIVNRTSAIASSLTRSAMRFIGTPYVFGGTRPSGFDCSGYVQHVFALLGVHLPRTADAQFGAGRRIQAAMEPGDLVFFHTYAPGVSHVGIYLGKNRFIHSASTRGVSISSLHDSYWAPRYLGAKRVFGS